MTADPESNASREFAVAAIEHFTARIEQRRREVMTGLNNVSQASEGQFFTPVRAAQIIASMFTISDRDKVRILDPGAGTGSLTAALVARLIAEGFASIEIVAVEKDETIVPALSDTLDDCVAIGRDLDVKVTTELLHDDLIEMHVGLRRAAAPLGQFDLIPMNPPYYKLSADRRSRLKPDGLDTPNIYSTFLLIAADLLADGGQLSAITPRSFANGTYFRTFRRTFLSSLALDRIHLFDSRKTLFADGGVLQENVIFSATKAGAHNEVVLSISRGAEDKAVLRSVPYAEVVKPTDPDSFVRLPTTDEHSLLGAAFDRLPCKLATVGLKASTGPVVDFRLTDHTRPNLEDDAVPLLYPSNFGAGTVRWPVEKGKNQAIIVNDVTRKWLVADERFVLVKRFSSKEERRRVVAAVYEPSDSPYPFLGIDNKLNFIHLAKRGLPRDFAYGLALWLNSTVLDKLFRTFSGHTQVNVGDLASMRYPSAESLTALGKALEVDTMPDQRSIDDRVANEVWGFGT